jgi:hypothetical protein
MMTNLFGIETVSSLAAELLSAGIPLDVIDISSGEQPEPRTDKRTINTLLEACSNSDLVMVLGGEDGVVALEIDQDKGGDETLRLLMEKIDLPINTSIVNPGNGLTYFLYRVEGTPLKDKAQIGSGLTLVANGHFIVVPPKDNQDRTQGWWKNFPTTMDDLAPIPEKLAALL